VPDSPGVLVKDRVSMRPQPLRDCPQGSLMLKTVWAGTVAVVDTGIWKNPGDDSVLSSKLKDSGVLPIRVPENTT
jgi:hypothetical protein